MTIWYCPLESYVERYTFQLQGWNINRFQERGVDYEIVEGKPIDYDKEIKVGQVLDAHGRCHYALTQVAELVKLMREGKITGKDVIFSEDMFHPGFESIFYILEQLPVEQRPKVFARCLAQSIDPDDFVHGWDWMRDYEKMVFKGLKNLGGIMMANTEFGVHAQIAKMDKMCPIYITGLPYDKNEVRGRVKGELKPLNERTRRVVYASRWDTEKQPHFIMDLIEKWHNEMSDDDPVEFVILSGSKALKSNNQDYVDRANQLEKDGKLIIKAGLSKNEYYEYLADSQVIFNCARQDWVSNTINEATTFGVHPLYPAFRSFPETCLNNDNFMYVPWSLSDAFEKLDKILNHTIPSNSEDINGIAAICNKQHETIDKTIDILLGNGSQYRYSPEQAYYKSAYENPNDPKPF